MTDSIEWTGRVGIAWAEEWRRTDRSFGDLTRALLDQTQIRDFAAALDVGCGAGEVALELAIAHPAARITGLDISPELLAVARARSDEVPNLAFAEGDAAFWKHDRGHRPGLIVSRHGVMFFDEPVAAFANLRAEAAPGARLRFTSFRAREDNAWAQLLAQALRVPPAQVDPHAPGPFAFADRDHVSRILSEAGWQDIGFEPVDYAMIAGEGDRAAEEALAYFQRIGPAARALAEMTADRRSEAVDRLGAVIAAHQTNGSVTMPAAAWIVTARAP